MRGDSFLLVEPSITCHAEASGVSAGSL